MPNVYYAISQPYLDRIPDSSIAAFVIGLILI